MTAEQFMQLVGTYGISGALIVFGLLFFYFKFWPWFEKDYWFEIKKREAARLMIDKQQNDVLIKMEALFDQMVPLLHNMNKRIAATDDRVEEIHSILIAQLPLRTRPDLEKH